MQESFGGEHLRRDADAGGYHRSADEDGFVRRLAPQQQDAPAHQEWDHYARTSYQRRRASHLHQVRGAHLQSHAEQQEHRAQVRERRQEFIGGNQAEHAGSDHNSRDDLPYDAGLAEAFEDLGQQFGGDKHQ